MNIHEYQAKKILKEYGIAIPNGKIAYTPTEAKKVALEISSRGPWMLKSQIQAGSRADGYFIGHSAGNKGGIRQVNQLSNISYEATQMLNNTLVTNQTSSTGKLVSKIYIEEFKNVKKSFYAGMIIDSSISAITLLISEIINKNIVELATSNYNKILKINLEYGKNFSSEDILRILDFLSLDKSYLDEFMQFFNKIHKTFVNLDAQMIEVNPVGITEEKKLMALDAKINFDKNALFRHQEITQLRDEYEEDDRYMKAQKYGFQYNEFDGNIGCIVNGEGLALEAMDIIKEKGGSTACFLNVKGGVDKDKISAGIKIIMTNPRVEGIIINILGGFLRCNLIADGILAATQEVGLNMPMVMRIEGTNKKEAIDILTQSNLPIIFEKDTNSAIDTLLTQMEVND